MARGRDIVRRSNLIIKDEPDNIVGYYIEENVVLPGIQMDQAYTIDEFQDEQLHEVKQSSSFAQGVDQHIKNASIEFPTQLFVDVVRMARTVPFDTDSNFWASRAGMRGGCERHPALTMLANWWSENRPTKSVHTVGYAMPWVRVRDDAEYWCGYYETPNLPLEAFEDDSNSQARIGEAILLVFFASHDHYTADADGVHVVLADGSPYLTVGMDAEDLESGECDEAWYALQALSSFPERFPVAWKGIQVAEKIMPNAL